jgi:hypothetical protein
VVVLKRAGFRRFIAAKSIETYRYVRDFRSSKSFYIEFRNFTFFWGESAGDFGVRIKGVINDKPVAIIFKLSNRIRTEVKVKVIGFNCFWGLLIGFIRAVGRKAGEKRGKKKKVKLPRFRNTFT